MLVYLLLLAAVVALGYFTDVVDFAELKTAFSLNLTALLKLAVMVLLVLLVSNLVIFILRGIKPRTHRGGSVLSLLSSLVKYVAGIIIVCQGLSLLGVNVGTIIASVGVLALVVGFSAESLIADVVIGAFMLLENQYNVGDIVEINGFRGVVTKIGIRTTSITDAGGNVKIINNSEMKNILNRSDNNSWSVSDISIPYETDLEKLEAQLPALLEDIFRARGDVMLEAPQYLGVQTLDASGIVLRFWVKVAEKNIYAGARALNRELLLGFRRLGVECPFPQMDHGGEEQGVYPGAGARCTSPGERCPPAGGPAAGYGPSRRGVRRGKRCRSEKEGRQVEEDRFYAGGPVGHDGGGRHRRRHSGGPRARNAGHPAGAAGAVCPAGAGTGAGAPHRRSALHHIQRYL